MDGISILFLYSSSLFILFSLFTLSIFIDSLSVLPKCFIYLLSVNTVWNVSVNTDVLVNVRFEYTFDEECSIFSLFLCNGLYKHYCSGIPLSHTYQQHNTSSCSIMFITSQKNTCTHFLNFFKIVYSFFTKEIQLANIRSL
jgi:hypothetical protein